MKVAIIRNTEGQAVGLWWHYGEERQGVIELVKAYADMIMNDTVFDAMRALNASCVKATFEPEVLQAMIEHPACFVDFVELDQRLEVVK